MSGEAERGTLSLQDSLNILAKALEMVSKNSKKYYLKKASEVSEKELKEVDISLVPLAYLIIKFGVSWLESRRSGPDAVEVSPSLEDRIDIKLVRTGNLDFEQFKKIVARLNRADDALKGLRRIDFYMSYYKNICAEKKLNKQVEHTDLFRYGVLNQTIESIKSDAEALTSQIGRCNLYYQNVLRSKTFKVAFVSLLISALAVFLSVLNTILPTVLNLLNC